MHIKYDKNVKKRPELRYMKTDNTNNTQNRYKILHEEEDFNLYECIKRLSCIEILSLNIIFDNAEALNIFCGTDQGECLIVNLNMLNEVTLEFLKILVQGDAIKVMFDGKEVIKELMKLGVELKGLKFDIITAFSIIETGSEDIISKDVIMNKYINQPAMRYLNWRNELSNSHNDELAKFSESTILARELLVEKIYSNKLARTAKLEFDFLEAISKIELNGIRILKEGINNFTNVGNYNFYTERVYPLYDTIGKQTGRVYCKNPNLQGTKRINRKFIIPKLGCKFIIADYSQMQLRIAAEISQDQVMIESFLKNEDIHRKTAGLVLKKPLHDISEYERKIGKAINFGLLFGMSSQRFKQYASENFMVQLTDDEAKRYIKSYFAEYSGYANWVKKILKTPKEKVKSLNGRKRQWFGCYTNSAVINYPIQATEADIFKIAIIKLHETLKDFDATIVLLVHDEIIVESAESQVEQIKGIVKECMVSAAKELIKTVPIEVDIILSDHWE